MKKVLVVGFGSVGLRHAQNICNLGHQAKVVSKRSVKKFLSYKDTATGIREYSPDLIIIASATSDHLRHLEIAVDFEIPSIIEKPLGTSFNRNFKEILKTIKKKNLIHCYRVGYLMRYHPLVVQLKKDLPKLSDISFVHSQFGQYLPWWRNNQNYQSSYSASKKLGGGVLFDSSHEIDLIQYLFGKIDSISGDSFNLNHLNIDSDEVCNVVMKTKKNTIVNLSLDYFSRIPSRIFRVEGKKGTIVLDFIKNTYSYHYGGHKRTYTKLFNFTRNDIFITEIKDFIDNPRKSLLPDIDFSSETLKIFDAINNQSRKNKWIKI